MLIDLDAARRARAEARGDANSVLLGGREFALISEVPVGAAEAWAAYQSAPQGVDSTEARRFVFLVLADPSEVDGFMETRPTWRDMEGLLGALNTTPGESQASTPPSKNGKRSRPTSKSTTKSTT